jgi:hypothetical protein
MLKYLQYLKDGKLPEWEEHSMITKYYTTMQALKLAVTKQAFRNQNKSSITEE